MSASVEGGREKWRRVTTWGRKERRIEDRARYERIHSATTVGSWTCRPKTVSTRTCSRPCCKGKKSARNILNGREQEGMPKKRREQIGAEIGWGSPRKEDRRPRGKRHGAGENTKGSEERTNKHVDEPKDQRPSWRGVDPSSASTTSAHEWDERKKRNSC